EVKVVRRWVHSAAAPPVVRPPAPTGPGPKTAEIRLVAIGASTGGPLVLQTILAALPKNFRAPIVVVQHMAAGFASGFAEWLDQTTGHPVKLATHEEALRPGHVYVAPDDFQMKVSWGGRVVLAHSDAVNGLRPSVSYLFRSVAD